MSAPFQPVGELLKHMLGVLVCARKVNTAIVVDKDHFITWNHNRGWEVTVSVWTVFGSCEVAAVMLCAHTEQSKLFRSQVKDCSQALGHASSPCTQSIILVVPPGGRVSLCGYRGRLAARPLVWLRSISSVSTNSAYSPLSGMTAARRCSGAHTHTHTHMCFCYVCVYICIHV